MFSNKLQKVILIIGTIIFVIVMLTLPSTGGRIYSRTGTEESIGAVFARGLSVIAITALLLFLTKTRKKI
ncbi:MAG: hypothetical protein QG646_1702 [Euryarchaeota archaeon]|nr:hypothetical protein [Euryarchaeota archaeon]